MKLTWRNGEAFYWNGENREWFSRSYYKLKKHKLDELIEQKEERI